MKDFHDLHSLILSSQSAPFENLKTIVHAVFDHRKPHFYYQLNAEMKVSLSYKNYGKVI
jgi:hypothetical protein